MMTEQEKQAIQEIFNKRLKELAPVADFKLTETFWDDVKAKLSPKPPPKGHPCEVWNEGELMRHLRIADGSGDFFIDVADHSGTTKWDHYRVIYTARDVKLALVERMHKYEAMTVERCVAATMVEMVERLIDNAQEG